MKTNILLCILAISYCSFGQTIKGVDFDAAVPYEELTVNDFMNLKGLFVKDKDGIYMWMWNVTTVGYARSLEKNRDLLEANGYGQIPDRDRSIIPSSVRDVFSEYNDMVHYCSMQEAEVLMYWYIHEDWVLGWVVNDLIAATSLLPMSEELERHRPTELERQQQAEQYNNLGRDAFGNQGVRETEGSEGITQGSGNQGDPNGSPDADDYGTGGGLGNNPFSYGLGSRKARGTWPIPNMSGCDITQKIDITVEVQVDRNGNVISAMVTNANYQNKCIWDMVVEAAKKSKFTVDQNANTRQTGWIKYIIVP